MSERGELVASGQSIDSSMERGRPRGTPGHDGRVRLRRFRTCTISLVLLVLCSVAWPVFAGGVPGPVCKREEVVQYVTNAIGGAEFNTRIDHRTIAEVPTSRPDLVLCYAWVRITFYNTARFGPVPLIAYQTREYSVRKLINGFEVAISPAQGPFP